MTLQIVSSYSNAIQSAPNGLSYDDITSEYEDSIQKFLWCNAPFVNWKGTLLDIDSEDETLTSSYVATRIRCLINIKISKAIEGELLLSFYKNDAPSVFNNLQELPIGSNVYFSFEPWQIREGFQLQNNIVNNRFDVLGGLIYIGIKQQLYSEEAHRIVEYYDSLRVKNPSTYIRLMDSIPSEFARLSEEEQLFIKEFSSFRNIYDEHYPRHSK